MFSWLANAWRVPELRRRVLFTALILAIYRLGSWMPGAGRRLERDQGLLQLDQGGTVLGLLNLFSGGALSQFSIFALGIMPYVTASIILQLLTVVIPRLEQLQKEGEAGYAKINQYTRYLTVVLAAAQSLGYAYLFKRQGVLEADLGRTFMIVLTLDRRHDAADVDGRADHEARRRQRHLAADLRVDPRPARRPGSAPGTTAAPMEKLFFPLIALSIVAAVVFIQEGQRKIPDPVRETDGRPPHDRGRIDLHAAAREHGRRHPDHLRGRGRWPSRRRSASSSLRRRTSSTRTSPPSNLTYLLFEAFLIIIFTYFYTAVQFNPVDQADQLRKHGGYIPGIRPGPPTAAVPRPRADAPDAARCALPARPSPSCRASSSATAASRRRPRALWAVHPC